MHMHMHLPTQPQRRRSSTPQECWKHRYCSRNLCTSHSPLHYTISRCLPAATVYTKRDWVISVIHVIWKHGYAPSSFQSSVCASLSSAASPSVFPSNIYFHFHVVQGYTTLRVLMIIQIQEPNLLLSPWLHSTNSADMFRSVFGLIFLRQEADLLQVAGWDSKDVKRR